MEAASQKILQELKEMKMANDTLAATLTIEMRTANGNLNMKMTEEATLLQKTEEQSRNLHECLLEREVELRTSHEELLGVLQSRLTTLQSESTSQLNEVHQQLNRVEEEKLELQQQWERACVEVDKARTELDQYRTRAQCMLQDKENLIAELLAQGSPERSTHLDYIVKLELEELQHEREVLRKEVSELSAPLQTSCDELQEMEGRLEAHRDQASHSIKLLYDNLQEERKKRQAAEDQCRNHPEELRSVREERSRHIEQLHSRLHCLNTEVTEL